MKVLRRNWQLSCLGITRAIYDSLLKQQSGVCALCGAPPSVARALCVDHDHACCPGHRKCCGKCVRGLLCINCNRKLSVLESNPDWLGRAISYLKRTS